MPFAANIAVVIIVIVAAIMIAFLYLHASDVHQHAFKRSRVQNLRAYKTWILSNSWATGWQIKLITWRLEYLNAVEKCLDFM